MLQAIKRVFSSRQTRQKVYDGFTFYNELDLLELRLNELDKVVDQFVIVEATRTFRNNPKPLYFADNRHRFRDFLGKIIHVVVDDMPGGDDPWMREHHQRNCIVRGLKDIRADDLVIISDVDEIVRPELVGQTGTFKQQLFYYYLNTKKQYDWDGPKCVRGEVILSGTTPQQLRQSRDVTPIIENGGWHFSYLGDQDFISNKIREFSHHEYDHPDYTNPATIRERLSALADPFAREGEELIRVDLDDTFPKTVLAHPDRYVRFVLTR